LNLEGCSVASNSPQSLAALCDRGEQSAKSACSHMSVDSQLEFFQQSQTIFIFDWDDTLLPSSWLKRNLCLLSDIHVREEIVEPLEELAVVVRHVLETARELGEVVIITNAESGWIDLSCRKWFPSLHEFVMGFNVISARSTWEPHGITSPCGWKQRAFETAIDVFYSRYAHQSWKNIISIGDSPHEREALMRVTLNSSIKGCRSKSVCLMIRPSVAQLQRQLVLLQSSLRHIVHHDAHLDLQMQGG
jgi:hypothetical protein